MDHTTSLSLLACAANAEDDEAWQRMVAIYQPLVRRWILSYDVQEADADDLIQEVMTAVFDGLPSFDHNGNAGAFRTWLRRILANRLYKFWHQRANLPVAAGANDLLERIGELEDETSSMSRWWNEEHDRHVLGRLLEATKHRFEPRTWEAFFRQAIKGDRADLVASELGMSLSSVYVARSRVLGSLRREAAGLVDSV